MKTRREQLRWMIGLYTIITLLTLWAYSAVDERPLAKYDKRYDLKQMVDRLLDERRTK